MNNVKSINCKLSVYTLNCDNSSRVYFETKFRLFKFRQEEYFRSLRNVKASSNYSNHNNYFVLIWNITFLGLKNEDMYLANLDIKKHKCTGNLFNHHLDASRSVINRDNHFHHIVYFLSELYKISICCCCYYLHLTIIENCFDLFKICIIIT